MEGGEERGPRVAAGMERARVKLLIGRAGSRRGVEGIGGRGERRVTLPMCTHDQAGTATTAVSTPSRTEPFRCAYAY